MYDKPVTLTAIDPTEELEGTTATASDEDDDVDVPVPASLRTLIFDAKE